MTEWHDFFVAAAGAAGALAGLVIVAISVNIKQILKYSQLPPRAAATIGMLILILVSSMAALIPGQSPSALGLEILIFGILGLVLQINAAIKGFKSDKDYHQAFGKAFLAFLFGQAQVWPFIIAGLVLPGNLTAGLNWLAAAIITVFILSMFNTWVLLVEILR